MTAASAGQSDDNCTLVRLLERRAAETPGAPAFHVEGASGTWSAVSWREVVDRVRGLRAGLQAAGLRSGDRFAIVAPVSLEWELLHHAALAMGAVVVGLDAHDRPERIAAMSEQAEVVAFAVVDPRVLAGISVDRLNALCFVLVLRPDLAAQTTDQPNGVRFVRWEDLQASAGAASNGTAPTSTDAATIVFTSGTSGLPKGIVYSHAQVCAAAAAIADAFEFIGPGSRLLCWLPLSNLFQRVVNLGAVRSGASTWLLSDPRRVMTVVGQAAPDVFIGVPRFYEKLYHGIRQNIDAQPSWRRWLTNLAWEMGRRVSARRLASKPVPGPWRIAHRALDAAVLSRIRQSMGSRLKCMVSGSAPMPVWLLEEFHALGWLVLEAYGLSENVMPMAMNRLGDFRFGTVGRPVAANVIEIRDGQAVAVRGPGVFGGYLGDSAGALLDPDGFFVTGDLGTFDADGRLRLTGRANDLIKTSTGRRIAPAPIEMRLAAVSGIDQVVLIGNGRKCPVALCTCEQPRQDDSQHERLLAALRVEVAALPEHERPCAIILLDSPFSIEKGDLTPNLKLRRHSIEARYAELIEPLYRQIDQPSPAQQSGRLLIV